jgi:hypothetical protein
MNLTATPHPVRGANRISMDVTIETAQILRG